MAGFVMDDIGSTARSVFAFHTGDRNLRQYLNRANQNRQIMILQLDGDELEVVLAALDGKSAQEDGVFVHECEANGCGVMVEFDDEPFCFTHSPDKGSSMPGYSAKARQEEILDWMSKP
jgi:hypothetical protein